MSAPPCPTALVDPAPTFRRLRAELGLTQDDAAARVGVSAQVWGAWERGRRRCQAAVFREIVQTLTGGATDAQTDRTRPE